MGPAKDLRRYIWAILAAAVAISFAPIFTRLAMDHGEVGPTAAAFWRMALSVPVLSWMWWRSKPQEVSADGSRPVWAVWWMPALPGAIFGADLVAWHASLQFTTVANSTLFANCAVILVSLVGWLWLGERLSWTFAWGALMALGGVAVVLKVDISASPTALKGDLLALLTAVFYASYVLCVKWLRGYHDVPRLMAVSSLACSLLLLPLTLMMDERLFSTTPAGWWALIALAGVSHCAGQSLISWALAHLPASFSSVTLLIQPVGAALWGWMILGEVMSGWQGLGVLAVLGGIMLARKGSMQNEDRSAARLCVKCGYDLQATPDRCPECGAVPDRTQ